MVVSRALEEMCRVGKLMGAQALNLQEPQKNAAWNYLQGSVGTESLIVCSGVTSPSLVREAWSQSPSQS